MGDLDDFFGKKDKKKKKDKEKAEKAIEKEKKRQEDLAEQGDTSMLGEFGVERSRQVQRKAGPQKVKGNNAVLEVAKATGAQDAAVVEVRPAGFGQEEEEQGEQGETILEKIRRQKAKEDYLNSREEGDSPREDAAAEPDEKEKTVSKWQPGVRRERKPTAEKFDIAKEDWGTLEDAKKKAEEDAKPKSAEELAAARVQKEKEAQKGQVFKVRGKAEAGGERMPSDYQGRSATGGGGGGERMPPADDAPAAAAPGAGKFRAAAGSAEALRERQKKKEEEEAAEKAERQQRMKEKMAALEAKATEEEKAGGPGRTGSTDGGGGGGGKFVPRGRSGDGMPPARGGYQPPSMRQGSAGGAGGGGGGYVPPGQRQASGDGGRAGLSDAAKAKLAELDARDEKPARQGYQPPSARVGSGGGGGYVPPSHRNRSGDGGGDAYRPPGGGGGGGGGGGYRPPSKR